MKGCVEFEFTPKFLMNLNVGFQNPITKNLNAALKSLFSCTATTLFMLLFLIFYSPLACHNVYRFVASSLFSCCPIILCIIFVYYSCVDGTKIKDTN